MRHSTGMRIGIGLALASMLGALFLTASMFLFEDSLHDLLFAQGSRSLIKTYGGNIEDLDIVVGRAWQFLYNGAAVGTLLSIGTIAAALVLAVFAANKTEAAIATCSLAGGAFLSLVYWSTAAFTAPAIGSADLALRDIRWLGYVWILLYAGGLCDCLKNVFLPSYD